MALQLSPMESKDIENWTKADFESPSIHSDGLWSGAPSVESIAKLVDRRCQSLLDPTIRYLKITVQDTGEIIASSKWHIHLEPGHQGRSGGSRQYAPDLLPEERTATMVELLDLFAKQRQLWLGDRPHLRLSNLATRPAHRRKGAASMLIRWGLDFADEQDVEVYTEAHAGSRTLYEKFGFVTVGTFEFDMNRRGAGNVVKYFVRRPHGSPQFGSASLRVFCAPMKSKALVHFVDVIQCMLKQPVGNVRADDSVKPVLQHADASGGSGQ